MIKIVSFLGIIVLFSDAQKMRKPGAMRNRMVSTSISLRDFTIDLTIVKLFILYSYFPCCVLP